MTEDEAFGLLGALVAATSGWQDDAIDIYAAEMRAWADRAAAQIAIADLCRTWTESRKPPLAVVVERYRAEHARNVRAEQEALPPPPEMYPSYERGWEIARQAYRVAYGREMGTKDAPAAQPAPKNPSTGWVPVQPDIQEPSQMEAARAITKTARDLAAKLTDEF